MARTSFAKQPAERLLRKNWQWELVALRGRKIGERSLWAMTFKYGGEKYGIFKATFSLPISEEQRKRAVFTNVNGIYEGRWAVMHVGSKKIIINWSEKEPIAMWNFLKAIVKSKFNGDKYLFSESIRNQVKHVQRQERIKQAQRETED